MSCIRVESSQADQQRKADKAAIERQEERRQAEKEQQEETHEEDQVGGPCMTGCRPDDVKELMTAMFSGVVCLCLWPLRLSSSLCVVCGHMCVFFATA